MGNVVAVGIDSVHSLESLLEHGPPDKAAEVPEANALVLTQGQGSLVLAADALVGGQGPLGGREENQRVIHPASGAVHGLEELAPVGGMLVVEAAYPTTVGAELPLGNQGGFEFSPLQEGPISWVPQVSIRFQDMIAISKSATSLAEQS